MPSIDFQLNVHGDVYGKFSPCPLIAGNEHNGGGMYFEVFNEQSAITIQYTNLVENVNNHTSELYYESVKSAQGMLSVINSTIVHTETHSDYGVTINGCCPIITLTNTRIRLTKQNKFGLYVTSDQSHSNVMQINDCLFERSQSVRAILYIRLSRAAITNCTFSNNTGDRSVITIDGSNVYYSIFITNSSISNNHMTGITIFVKGVIVFNGRNVIQNNRNTEGAGITLLSTDIIYIVVQGELLLYNNTADKHGGAILVRKPFELQEEYYFEYCSVNFQDNSSKLFFSGNRAGKGGSDMYGATLMGCYGRNGYVPHVGHPTETSWYLDTPLMKHLHFSNTDRLSSMSSDSIMVCFCNTTSNLPDCSDRTRHM